MLAAEPDRALAITQLYASVPSGATLNPEARLSEQLTLSSSPFLSEFLGHRFLFRKARHTAWFLTGRT